MSKRAQMLLAKCGVNLNEKSTHHKRLPTIQHQQPVSKKQRTLPPVEEVYTGLPAIQHQQVSKQRRISPPAEKVSFDIKVQEWLRENSHPTEILRGNVKCRETGTHVTDCGLVPTTTPEPPPNIEYVSALPPKGKKFCPYNSGKENRRELLQGITILDGCSQDRIRGDQKTPITAEPFNDENSDCASGVSIARRKLDFALKKQAVVSLKEPLRGSNEIQHVTATEKKFRKETNVHSPESSKVEVSKFQRESIIPISPKEVFKEKVIPFEHDVADRHITTFHCNNEKIPVSELKVTSYESSTTSSGNCFIQSNELSTSNGAGGVIVSRNDTLVGGGCGLDQDVFTHSDANFTSLQDLGLEDADQTRDADSQVSTSNQYVSVIMPLKPLLVDQSVAPASVNCPEKSKVTVSKLSEGAATPVSPRQLPKDDRGHNFPVVTCVPDYEIDFPELANLSREDDTFAFASKAQDVNHSSNELESTTISHPTVQPNLVSAEIIDELVNDTPNVTINETVLSSISSEVHHMPDGGIVFDIDVPVINEPPNHVPNLVVLDALQENSNDVHEDIPYILDPEPLQDNLNSDHEDEVGVNNSNSDGESEAQEDNVQQKKKRIYKKPDKLTRKRQTNPEKWIANERHRKRLAGEEYFNRNGKKVPAKVLRDACKENCRFKCRSKLTEANRLEILNRFHEKCTSDEKIWAYITSVCAKLPKMESTCGDFSRRGYSYVYNLKVNGNLVKVCKTMFLNTLCISNSVVETAFNKLGPGGVISPSKRGKHQKCTRGLSEEGKNSVREHIRLFPKVDSHYTRSNSQRQYLEAGMTVTQMHRLYVKWMRRDRRALDFDVIDAPEEDDLENSDDIFSDEEVDNLSVAGEIPETVPDPNIATYRQYHDIFVKEFNLGTHQPKKDQCDLCTLFKNAKSAQKAELREQYDLHQAKKERSRALKDMDKDASLQDNVAFCCFDLQKVLYIPQGNASGFYYNSKLSVYNFTVFEIRKSMEKETKGYCFTWDQTVANRGSIEISSCLLKYFRTAKEEGVTEFRMWSDNATGQNKNRHLFACYVYASVVLGIKITHRFLIKGHTQNEGDNMHARIEQTSRGKKFFVPSHWRSVMRKAVVNRDPYIVVKMTQEDFFDFKDLSQKQNWEICDDGSKISYMNIQEIEVEAGHVKIKYDFDQDEPMQISVDRRRSRPVNLKSYKFNRAYKSKIPLPAGTKKGILTIIKSGVIPRKYCKYLKTLCEI